MKNNNPWASRVAITLAPAMLMCLSSPAQALNFNLGGIDASFTSDISVGASWRMEEASPNLYWGGNKAGGLASGANTDDGNLNFEDGEMYSLILKGVHDLELSSNNIGLVFRFKYWYDFELEDGDRPHGTTNNGYVPNEPLEDSTYNEYAKNKGARILDAFVYGDFDLGRMPLNLRLGRQVVSWGESTFIQGSMNGINPVDVSAFRRPGVEIKEGLLPVGMVYGSLGMTDNLSVEAFYQYEWEKFIIDSCGGYYSDADFAADGCNVLTVQNASTPTIDDATALGLGLYITREEDREPDDAGQYGIAFRYFAEGLNSTEFGFYYTNLHSRLPLYTGATSQNLSLGGVDAPFIPGDPFGGNPVYWAEFPEDLKTYGLSVATNLGGWALSGEVSYHPDFPLQVNSTELLQASLAEVPWSPLTPVVLALPEGGSFPGYDPYDYTQAQLTVIKTFFRVLGTSQIALVGEIGGAWVDGLPPTTGSDATTGNLNRRYGRSPIYGMGSFPTINLGALGTLTCEGRPDLGIVPNGNPANCTDEGYVTDMSWGYRARLVFQYDDVFKGINLVPSISWSHDVSGWHPVGVFNEGSKALGLSLSANYLQRYTFDLFYTSFSGGDYNTRVDRDFAGFSMGVSF
jgi:hypothetical protein